MSAIAQIRDHVRQTLAENGVTQEQASFEMGENRRYVNDFLKSEKGWAKYKLHKFQRYFLFSDELVAGALAESEALKQKSWVDYLPAAKASPVNYPTPHPQGPR